MLFHDPVYGQRFDAPVTSLKTNLLTAPAGSINAAVEQVLRKQITFDDSMTSIYLPLSYNPFTYSNNKKVKHIAFQPEFRLRKPTMSGSYFIGANINYAFYNVGGIDLPLNIASGLKERRYQGQLFGGGLSGGYYFKLGSNVGLEASLSAGYLYLDHEVYRCITCGTKLGEESTNYLGLTNAVISFAYTIR